MDCLKIKQRQRHTQRKKVLKQVGLEEIKSESKKMVPIRLKIKNRIHLLAV